MLSRRHFLAFSASLVAAPRLAFGQGSGDGSAKRILRFVPAADLSVLDPITASANITRDHAFLVFDTLYGSNAELEPSLQMLGAEDVSADGLKWTLTLRDGLKFHDGTPVRAEDCVTSIKRWWKRDLLGQSLAKVTADLSAPDDKTIVFTLSQPYPRLPATLGKTGANICAIMPARLAATDPNTPVTEIVGSGPFRFVAGERIPGSLVVYERFEDYVPQPNGVPSFTAGPKIAKFDRIEWHIIPDSATAISALTNGEVDWVAQPLLDLLPVVQGNPDITVARVDTFGMIGVMRPNFLMPPFDNPEIRKIVMRAIDQRTFMAAISGDTDLTHTPAGFFTPGTPMASDAGFDIIEAPKDYDKLKQELIDAGYKGERVVVMTPADFPTINAIATVGAALLTRLGMDVDLQTMDWGTVVQRRANKGPQDAGGWNVFFTYWQGLDSVDPTAHPLIRGTGEHAWFGWPTLPKLEALRTAWIAAAGMEEKKAIAADLQRACFEEAPYFPLGQLLQPAAFRSDLHDMPKGFSTFWGVNRA